MTAGTKLPDPLVKLGGGNIVAATDTRAHSLKRYRSAEHTQRKGGRRIGSVGQRGRRVYSLSWTGDDQGHPLY